MQLPEQFQKSFVDLTNPKEREEGELKSTLKEPERKSIWKTIDKLEQDLNELRGIVQNPMPLKKEDVLQWSIDMNKLIDELMALDNNIKMLTDGRII